MVKEYQDIGSGASKRRPGFQQLLRDVQDGVIDTVHLWRKFRPGPLVAIRTFLAAHPEFGVDEERVGRFRMVLGIILADCPRQVGFRLAIELLYSQWQLDADANLCSIRYLITPIAQLANNFGMLGADRVHLDEHSTDQLKALPDRAIEYASLDHSIILFQ